MRGVVVALLRRRVRLLARHVAATFERDLFVQLASSDDQRSSRLRSVVLWSCMNPGKSVPILLKSAWIRAAMSLNSLALAMVA